jgi:RNA polymerase sigma-70 factor (ECF subfamily)
MIKSLDSEERQIVLLHVVSDMKFKTIAEVVNKPLGTVLWIYQKALKKIKQSLREEPS